MNTYYKKLYKKTITLPFIRWEGVNDDNSDYYAVLEKNYVPITSTETWDKSDDDWVQIELKEQDQKFNRLIVKSCKQNDGEVRTRLFEFNAQVPVNGSNGIMINPCNSIYAIIRQEPKTDIKVVIKFEKLNDSQILSADSKTLEINGDEQLIKIIYYGLKGDGDESIKIVSNISLYINGTNVDNDVNVQSLERTANGIILLYKIPENAVSNRQLDVVCTYTSDYDRHETDTAYIKQGTNTYEIELMCNNSTGPVQINSDNFNLYCKLIKNNEILKEKIEFVYDYVTNSPIIIRTGKILNQQDNGLYVDVSLEKNFTPVIRKVSVYAKYKTYKSNTIEIIQNSSSIQIYTVCDGNRVNTVNIDGNKQEKTVQYYAIATAASGDTKQIISYTNTYSAGTKNIKLTNKDSEVRLLYDKDLNFNTRESQFQFEKNRTGYERSYTVTYGFEGTDITKTINFKQNYINIDITPISGNNGNIIIGGLKEYDPYVDIQLIITENSSSDDIELTDIDVSIINGNTTFENCTKSKVGNNIQIRYYVIQDLGFSGGNKNYESRLQRYDYTITYFNKTFTGTITRYPIYYGVNIVGGDEKVSGVYGSAVQLDIYAILYNRKDDWTHYIKAADNNLNITINPNTYVTQNIISTSQIKQLTLTHSKNDTGADRSLTVNVSYLDMNEQSTQSNTDPIVVTKKTITQDSIQIAAVIQVWNEANTQQLTGNELSILEPWKTNVFTLKGYLIDDTDGNRSVITSAKQGEFIIKQSPSYKYNITSYNNTAGITTAKLTVQPTFIYDPNHVSFIINFKVEHNATFSTTIPAQIQTYTITSYEKNTQICTDNQTYTSFHQLETNAFTSGNTVTIRTYVQYMTTQTSYYIDTVKDHYTLQCTKQPESQDMKVDGDAILFTYQFSSNETTENKEYQFTLEYTNENYIGTPYHYYRHIKLDKDQDLTFVQPPLDYIVYISYEQSFNGPTSKEINALEHADVYVYVKVMLGDENVTINEGDITITPSYLKFVKSLQSGTIQQYKVVDDGKDVVEMNIGSLEKTWTIYVTYKERESQKLQLTQNYLTQGNRLNVTVSANPTSVDYNGGDVIFTYYLTYDSIKIDVTEPLSWTTSLDNNGTLTQIETTGTVRTCKYEYPLNTTASNSITFTAEVLGISDSVTVTQSGAEFYVKIETNHDTIGANGGSFILTYYGTINGVSTNENITLQQEPTDTYKPTSQDKDTSGNIIKETFNVDRNMTEAPRTFTYTVTFNAPGDNILTNTVTITQAESEFDCVLSSNIYNLDANGGSFILTYYGLINGASTNENITLQQESADSYKPTSSDKDISGNIIKETFNVDRNMTEAPRTFTYTVTFKVTDDKILTNTVTITQSESGFGCELSSNIYNLDANGGSFTLTYYGLINGASTNENITLQQEPTDTYKPVSSNKDMSGNVIKETFNVERNMTENSRTFTYTVTFKVTDDKILTNTVTITQAESEFGCELKSNIYNFGANGGSFKLTYYGLINGIKTNQNVSVAQTDNIQFNPTPGTELDDNINNIKTKEFTVQETPYETERMVTYMATYTVDGKNYNSNSVTITQAANSFSCYLYANTDKQTISGMTATTVTFTFYGEKSTGKVIDNVTFVCDEGNDNITITEGTPVDPHTRIVNVVFNMNFTAYQKTYKFHAEYTYDGTNKKLSDYIVITQEIPIFNPVIIVDNCTYDTTQSKYLIPSEKIDSLKICYYGKIEDFDVHITDINLFNELKLTQYNSEKEFECTYVSGPTQTKDYIYCIYSVPENLNKHNELLEPLFKEVSVSLKNDETKVATCVIKQIGDEVYMADFDYFAFKYRIVSGTDLDTATSLRTDKDVDFETDYIADKKDNENNLTGYYHNLVYNKDAFVGFMGTLDKEPIIDSSINPMHFYGDNLGNTGYECVTVCIKDILKHSKSDINTYVDSKIYIDIFGSWYQWQNMYPGDIKNPNNYGTLEIIFETYSKLDPSYTDIPFTKNGSEYQVDKDNARLVDRIGPFIIQITGKGTATAGDYSDATGFRVSYAHFAILEYDIKENKPKLYVVHNNENNKYDHTVLSLNMITGEYNERTRQDNIPYYYPTGQLYCLSADGLDASFGKYKVDKFKNGTFVSMAGNIDNCP